MGLANVISPESEVLCKLIQLRVYFVQQWDDNKRQLQQSQLSAGTSATKDHIRCLQTHIKALEQKHRSEHV